MSFRVLYRNLEIVCETIEDIDKLADGLEQRNGAKNAPVTVSMPSENTTQKPPVTNQQSEKGFVKEGQIAAFLKNLTQKPLGILNALANAPNGLSDSELREAVGIESKVVLAGTMSAIAKLAKKDGISYQDIVTKTITDNKHGDRKYHY